jgi:hypothetical protein
MGPVADRTSEHLGVSDTIIIKLRRFLLSAVRDHEAGATPPGLDPTSHHVRSARFTTPRGTAFSEVANEHVKIIAKTLSGD